MQQRRDEHLVVGLVVGLLGVKGWIKIESYTEPRGNIEKYSPWQLSVGEALREFEVEAVQRHGKGMVAKLVNIGDRNQAVELLSSEIWVSPGQLEELEQGELYWCDLIGLSVVNRSGELLGQVESLFETGANDVLVVRGQGQEILIPYLLEQVVLSVDREQGQIQVDWELDWL